jgi:hypothetical protein
MFIYLIAGSRKLAIDESDRDNRHSLKKFGSGTNLAPISRGSPTSINYHNSSGIHARDGLSLLRKDFVSSNPLKIFAPNRSRPPKTQDGVDFWIMLQEEKN